MMIKDLKNQIQERIAFIKEDLEIMSKLRFPEEGIKNLTYVIGHQQGKLGVIHLLPDDAVYIGSIKFKSERAAHEALVKYGEDLLEI